MKMVSIFFVDLFKKKVISLIIFILYIFCFSCHVYILALSKDNFVKMHNFFLHVF